MNPVESSSPLFNPNFEKYTVDKQYHLIRTNPDGSSTLVPEGDKLLDSDFFQGSIAYTRDHKHVTLVHKIIYVFQLVHSWWTGRALKADPDVCHGMVILGKGVKGKDRPHPFLVAHAVFKGVLTSNWDSLQEDEVSELTIYRPVDGALRELCRKNAEGSAYVEDEKFRTKSSPKEKNPISLWDMFSSIFYNPPHQACGKKGLPPDRLRQKTASVVADVLLGNQFMNEKGEPAPLFCTSYTWSVLQGSLVERGLQDVSESDKKRFMSDAHGYSLKRDLLIERIKKSFEKEDPSNGMAQRLWSIYSSQKLARLDAEYLMSAYAVKTLDKHSFRVVKAASFRRANSCPVFSQ